MNKTNKGLIVSALALTAFLAGCGESEQTASGQGGETSIEGVPERFATGEEVNVRVIRKLGGDDHTAQFLAGVQEEGQALGFNVDVFAANGDTAKFHDAINQAITSGVDGLILSHGDDAATVDAVKRAREQGIEVVAFDSISELSDLDGVTLTSQDDEALAQLALDQLVDDYNGEANIAYLWVDGFPPMVRRNAVYTEVLEEHPGIQELSRFGVASEDTSVQTQNAVAALLNQYPEGDLDAIFATWDAFAIGAARAIQEAGRTDVSIYGIDVSNADLQIIQQEDSAWAYTAAVDPKLIGAINTRILAKKLAGEETPATYDLEATLISREDLAGSSEPVNMVTLADVIPDWGESDAFEEEWITTLKDYYKQ
ncbi:simple sugar transport system substrate-binding protein [Alkalihalobacillus xiaoxiensis]|uniref:Simple sugar transport system substrate-binding protein n=1 Tax=Shouchella xiaoxiensis TaxID=766895 RepID=A0ABS2SQK2_9BACI|nr:sugar ABC transporter substrate-binding protein [Shouchella xiaoxiensis]MBM7837788.1 simple sugar transport system substrate-binding protein [Shouchella xiaoxiensis]